MNKLLIFLVLLSVPLRSAGKDFPDRFDSFTKLQDLEVEEEEEEDGDNELEVLSWESARSNKVLVNVDGFGAVGDGVSDDSQAFVNAWKQACSTPKSVLLVPEGRRYLVNATRFKGPCADKLVIQIEGTIVAPDEPKSWDPKNPRNWLSFYNLTKAVTIDSSSAIRVKGLTIQNGQQMNFVIGRSDSVRVIDVKVSAPEDSPNTDGIHITDSTNVVLQNCRIGTGDDCISIVNGSTSIKMKNIYCGPGHGISIGSLGKDNSTGIVEKIVLDKAFLRGTTNGLRIKTWQTSAVEISQIMYRNVTGTSKSQKAMKFACSDTVPCTHIVLNNINLQRSDGTVETYCNSAAGFGYGYIQPSAECLSSSDKDKIIMQKKETETAQTSTEHLIHTEL
ncbi:hypothetical protein DH2020_035139 [Rehmannia glutinosa]|uniref:Polygalacturonase n=1 Tax=Rehmannia glutinosa TaxID=99300 RepID=A0ABR0VA91_REHGL